MHPAVLCPPSLQFALESLQAACNSRSSAGPSLSAEELQTVIQSTHALVQKDTTSGKTIAAAVSVFRSSVLLYRDDDYLDPAGKAKAASALLTKLRVYRDDALACEAIFTAFADLSSEKHFRVRISYRLNPASPPYMSLYAQYPPCSLKPPGTKLLEEEPQTHTGAARRRPRGTLHRDRPLSVHDRQEAALQGNVLQSLLAASQAHAADTASQTCICQTLVRATSPMRRLMIHIDLIPVITALGIQTSAVSPVKIGT